MSLLLTSILLVSGCINTTSSGPSESTQRILQTMNFFVNDTPKINKSITITLTATTTPYGIVLPNSTLEIILPEGVELISGNLMWMGNMGMNDTVNVSAIVKATQIGTWIVRGDAISPYGGYYGHTGVYLIVMQDSGRVEYGSLPPCSGTEAEVMECMRTRTSRG